MRRALAVLLVFLPLLALLTAGAAVAASAPVYPHVSDGFGSVPKLDFPSSKAPTAFEEKVLSRGSGPVVKNHDLVVVNYLGQIWRGKVFDTNFDSSFKHHELFDFAVGRGQVIKGWDTGLTGARVGSRLLLVIPPADGYGAKGNTGAGITGTDDLVFVVDVVADYPTTEGGDAHASGLHSTVHGVQVTGALGGVPKIQIAKTAALPSSLAAFLVAKGDGPKVRAGLVVLQYVAAAWSGQVLGSTWASGDPEGDPVGNPQSPSYYDPLIGLPVGSRVLLEIPKTSQGGPYAVAIDIIGQPTEPRSK